jgi:CDP-diacylglycerol pyrophosphatase
MLIHPRSTNSGPQTGSQATSPCAAWRPQAPYVAFQPPHQLRADHSIYVLAPFTRIRMCGEPDSALHQPVVPNHPVFTMTI